jgi:hypothetical protein
MAPVIGVIPRENELAIVREFFQLFKTPWEIYDPGHTYDVVITTSGEMPVAPSPCPLVVYSSGCAPIDGPCGLVAESSKQGGWVDHQGTGLPVYGNLTIFRPVGRTLFCTRGTSKVVGLAVDRLEGPVVRIGYNLFQEVQFLLSQGQPAENARILTLDAHISTLRSVLVDLGVPFIEVLPVPAGYDFMVCLTHDVDFVGIRDHKLDHTMWGFLYRCLAVSLIQACTGRFPWSRCFRNWSAAFSLPLVYLGLREDFWLEFDRYMEIEREFGSTFFFISFKNSAGTLGTTQAPKRRAAKYDVVEIRERILELVKKGCEIGLHGIDAWQSLQKAKAEMQRLSEVTGQVEMGTRMHWLYWNEYSPKVLEEAGFDYDSTFGYNDAVGFRAGTTQPFCPLHAERLLELPLNIQDTAMFYVDRMMLSEAEALNSCKELIHTMYLSGGALTVNWHTRSLSPERLWGDFYVKLLKEIQTYRVWFATAQEIVRWFRKRRALHFDSAHFGENGVRVALSSPAGPSEPSFTVRIHHPRFILNKSGFPVRLSAHKDTHWTGADVLDIPY